MILLYLSWKNSRERSLLASGQVREHWLGKSASDKTEWVFVLAVTVGAMYVAYTCNSRSGAYNPYMMMLLAAIFPEVYLVQSTVRSLVKDGYSCAPRK